jgi:tripartite-type tricarboxylate transporter receptor subunit TctC
MKRKSLNVIFILFVLFIFISPNKDLHAAPYYEGKVIKLVVAFPPGGGYDRMARILSKHLPKHILGKPPMRQ